MTHPIPLDAAAVEKAAEAMFLAEYSSEGNDLDILANWIHLDRQRRMLWLKKARAAITAYMEQLVASGRARKTTSMERRTDAAELSAYPCLIIRLDGGT